MSGRIPVLYLAPWVGYGGSDKNTIDWFRWIDRERFAPYLITTQASDNPLMETVTPYAEEVWALPDLMVGEEMPAFIFDFIESRGIQVIHLMNSRIGFDLLPDIASLPSPPAVVVQLHVEEVDRSGYVRYVTTRYGNLVDRFSISNRHVADAVAGYGVPREKIDVIYTGVDADEEFSPQTATPAEELDSERLQILYAARITDQKDPLLMVEVAAGLRDRGVDFQIQVVGDGDLEDQLRARVGELDLGGQIVLHPPTPGLQGWYSACDVLLMTSKFEGIPCALFESMAMAMPIVAPALPGIRELLSEEDDGLIAERDSAEPYVEALAALAADPERRAAVGAEMRERAKGRFSVQEMAATHGAIYERLCAGREAKEPAPPAPLPEPLRFLDRPVLERPLVSVLIPHYNQVSVLRECLQSVREQSYPRVEIIVVDDASTAAGAEELLAELEADEGVTLVRMGENGGPSKARNAGLERCSGRYVLPVDADNLLLPDAIDKLVAQLGAAGEEIGFIYPNLDFFGNREEYHQAPPYNLYTLLHANFCDTCSLVDREVFDAGARYHEGIHLGHEDWEFALQLAGLGVRGEPAHGPTVRYRKWGFNRSDLVDHAVSDFREKFLAEASPFEGMEAQIKALESPTLSLVALAPVDADSEAGRALLVGLEAQTCIDLELVADLGQSVPPPPAAGPGLRRFPAGEAGETARRGLATSRGSVVALTTGTGAPLLADPSFAEKVLRRFEAGQEEIDAIALFDAGAAGRFDFAGVGPDAGADPEPVPHTIVWRRSVEVGLPYGLVAYGQAPVGSIARLLSGAGARVEWRHFASPDSSEAPLLDTAEWQPLPPDPARAEDPLALRSPPPALLPGRDEYEVPRWAETPTWIPALSTIAIRYREHFGERRIVVPGDPPQTFHLEHFLGSIRSTGVPGTKKLVAAEGTYRALPREQWRDELPADAIVVGYVEEAPLPGLDALALAVHRVSGEHVLVSLPEDPILHTVDVIEHLGFADPFPLRPRELPDFTRPLGLIGLAKSVDLEGRRHRYGIGQLPAGELVIELGALAESGLQGGVPAWIVGDYLITSSYRPPMRKPSGYRALRWTAEPAGWRDLGPVSARAKVMARRAAQSALSRERLKGLYPGPEADPDGWLFETPRPGLLPLYASHHPVTGDQLLTRSVEDAVEMGYEDQQLLGYLAAANPLTGDGERHPVGVPWARRSGHVPQSA